MLKRSSGNLLVFKHHTCMAYWYLFAINFNIDKFQISLFYSFPPDLNSVRKKIQNTQFILNFGKKYDILTWDSYFLSLFFFTVFCDTNVLLNHMRRPRRQCVFGHMQTAKAQIRLRICAVWSRPSLSTNRIIRYYRIFHWRSSARMWLCACAGWCESAHFAHAQNYFFAWRGLYLIA